MDFLEFQFKLKNKPLNCQGHEGWWQHTFYLSILIVNAFLIKLLNRLVLYSDPLGLYGSDTYLNSYTYIFHCKNFSKKWVCYSTSLLRSQPNSYRLHSSNLIYLAYLITRLQLLALIIKYIKSVAGRCRGLLTKKRQSLF